MASVTWEELKELANGELDGRSLDETYAKRLKFEFKEIEKQGATTYWLNLYNDKKRFGSNPNSLVLPWLLGMAEGDPISGRDDEILCTVKAAEVVKYRERNGVVPPDFVKDPDMPDIDLDCLPEARDPIKTYAAEKYGMGITDGYGPVCSVGTWQTYKFKSSVIDVCVATGMVDKAEAYELTTKLPDDVDDLKDGGYSNCKGRIKTDGEDKECGTSHNEVRCPNCQSEATDGPTIGKLIAEYEQLASFTAKYPDVIDYAVQIIGRVRNMGMHAGALIIADRTLFGNIPLAKSNNKGYWVSMWSEGRNTQLSKFGYIKWDILGLKTLKYIFECCRLIEQNRGITFGERKESESEHGQELPPAMTGWDDINPNLNRAGHFFDSEGNKHYISLNDEDALRLANEQKTDGIFQFDTDLAKSILANGVRNFEDLMLFNAMGHPGPMASIPEAVENRDGGSDSWKNRLHPKILDVLKDTYGVIVYQEQLQAIWQRVAGFTAPQAQEARKAVAKKWVHKLKPIREHWIVGASRVLGQKESENWWTKMETFGRYAFNRSHAVSYCLVAQRCLWLKAHFAPEWWAAVMSDCHSDKLVRYMGIARSEEWKPTDHVTYSGSYNPEKPADTVVFGTINIFNLTTDFTVTNDVVNQGMIGIKGIGESAAESFAGRGDFTDIDDFIEKKGGKSKTVLERFIKLGAFTVLEGHENIYATWKWYEYKYCSGKDITQLRREIRAKLVEKDGWNETTIEEERQRQEAEYKKQYPNRRKIPAKIKNWKPKPNDSRDNVISLYSDKEFTLEETLAFEKQYLGYYLHSPLDLYLTQGNCDIDAAKRGGQYDGVKLEVVITDLEFAVSKNNKEYARLFVSDGVQTALVLIFNNELALQNPESLLVGTGIEMWVDYDEMRGTFTMRRNQTIVKLLHKERHKEQK